MQNQFSFLLSWEKQIKQVHVRSEDTQAKSYLEYILDYTISVKLMEIREINKVIPN